MSTAPTGARPLPSYEVCGVRIDAATPEQACAQLTASRFGSGRSVHLCNAYTISLALSDPGYLGLLNRGDLNFADGHPVAAIGRRRGHADMTRRVYGPDLMLAAMDRGRAAHTRHYLYGGTPAVVSGLTAAMEERFPGVRIVGSTSPPFRPLTDSERRDTRDQIRAAEPDIVWVGLGTPRQDEWVDAERDSIGATLVAIGAAFDFLAGNKRQAPAWMQNAGLEWAFRLGTEPKRLWRRYLIGNARFVAGVTADELRRRRRA